MQKPPPLPGARPPRKPTSRFWRWVVRVAIALPLLGLLALLSFYVVENIRGRSAWTSCRKELTARGESLDPAAFATNAPLADSENFFTAPLVQGWFRPGPGSGSKPLPIPAGRAGNGGQWQQGWEQGVPARLAEWEDLFVVERQRGAGRRGIPAPATAVRGADTNAPVAQEILNSFAPHATHLTGLARLLEQRPRGRFSTDADRLGVGPRPNFQNLTAIASALATRASAQLALSNSAPAFEDVLLILRLADTLRGDPFLLPAMTRAGLIGQAIQPVWEGCAAGRWNDAQLSGFQRAFGAYDLAGEVALAMRYDRAFILRAIEESPRQAFNHAMASEWSRGRNGGQEFGILFAFAPHGWLNQNRASYCQSVQDQLAHLDAAMKVPPPREEPLPDPDQWWRRRPNPYTLLEMTAMQSTSRAGMAGLNTQNALGLLAVGCGIERHRLGAGTLPETLAQLVPAYLDTLPEGGQTVAFERGTDGRFTLTSAERRDNFGFERLPDDEARRNRPTWRYPKRR